MKIGITIPMEDRTFNGSHGESVYVESSEFTDPGECLAEISLPVRVLDGKAYMTLNRFAEALAKTGE